MNPDLTLKQIAFEWARELEDQKVPGRRSEREIFRNLVSAVRQGEFGPGPFEVQRTPRAKRRRSVGPDGQDIYKINPPYLVGLDGLRKVVDPDSGKGGIPWEERDVEDDEPLSVRAIWERLSLPKQKIGQWCDERAEKRPKFWFDDGRQVERGRPPGSSAAFSKRSAEPNLTAKSRRKGGSAPKYYAALQQFINQLAVEFKDAENLLTPPTLKTWLVKNAPIDEGHDTGIRDCDDIEFNGRELLWKDDTGSQKSLAIRSVDPYITRANLPA